MNVEDNKLIALLPLLCKKNMTKEVVRECVSFLDVTTLDIKDTPQSVKCFAENILAKIERYDLPDVASICVSPLFIESVGVVLGDSPISITSVVGNFPLTNTFIEVKMLECAMAIEQGADELDIVINVGAILEGEDEIVESELVLLKEEIGDDAILKVIIETGELGSISNIERATRIAISAGADFVKTSTGKVVVNATPEAVVAMCRVIKAHYDNSGEMIGVKVAGGVRSVEDMLSYYSIVKEILGEQWLDAKYFRVGASSLLDDIIGFLNK